MATSTKKVKVKPKLPLLRLHRIWTSPDLEIEVWFEKGEKNIYIRRESGWYDEGVVALEKRGSELEKAREKRNGKMNDLIGKAMNGKATEVVEGLLAAMNGGDV